MMNERIAGLLLHPSSLPGASGIGDLGREADRFLDWCAAGGMSVWQILPLGPTGHGDSPYSATSAFAGNPLLLSPGSLRDAGLLSAGDLEDAPVFPEGRVDFPGVAAWKEKVLRLSFERFSRQAPAELAREGEAFAAEPSRAAWLEDWVLYSALKARSGGAGWSRWPAELRRREPEALERARRELAEELAYHRYLQFLFHLQWERVRREAHRREIRILGDLPLYVAMDSADVWANQHLFDLDREGRPRHVAGVPPDYFSRTGQRWGNPLYLWERMAEEGFAWWIARVRENLRQADMIRIDHFRGLEAYWEIPAGEKTAVKGAWRPGPGPAILDALRAALGEVPLVAEDLGVITEEVDALKDSFELPGMRVLQFAFDSADSDHLPGRLPPRTVIYTGTHDNDTTRGWFEALKDKAARKRVLEFLGPGAEKEIHWEMIRAAFESEAWIAMVPVQDVLGLGSEARMNLPSRAHGNWGWRAAPGSLDPALSERLRRLAVRTGRAPVPVSDPPSAS
jgi:4-alpha-glucanotransferase